MIAQRTAFACGVAAFVLALAGPAAAQKVTWNWSVHGPSRAFTVGIEKVAEYVGQKSGGDFAVKIHFGEAVSPAKEVLDSVKIGAIEGGIMCIAYAPGKAPLIGVLDLPFLPFGNLDVQRQVHEAVYAHPAISEEMKRWGATAFFSALLPQYEFMGKGEPPQKLEGWDGMRVRALGGLGEAMKRLGAVPTTVPAPEVYTGLERGTFDAASFPFSYAHAAYKLHEVSDWYTLGMAIGTTNCPLVIGNAAFAALPEKYQALLVEAKPQAYEAMGAAYKAADDKNIPMFDAAGLTRVVYTPEQLAEFQKIGAKPVWDAWVAEMKSKGLPGQEVLDLVLAEAKKATGS